MKKILKTQGSLNQWLDLVALSLEQMGLTTENNENIIIGLHNGLQVMKFVLSEDDGIILAIDYFDERDLEDFKKFAAQIISDPDSYRGNSKLSQDSDSITTPQSNINDYIQRDSTVENNSKSSGNKGLKIALIIIGVFVFLAAAGFGGYKFYQYATIPKQKLSEAMVAYNKGDYGTAISIADSIIQEYPKCSQATDAQTLIDNANAELASLEKQKQNDAKKVDAQAHILITSTSLSGPDEYGDVSILIDYANTSDLDITSVTFGVTFTDANGNPVIVNGTDSAIITCIDSSVLAAGLSIGEGNLQFGPYNNSDIAGFNIVSVTAEYSDGSTVTLATPEEVTWIMSQQ